MGSTKDMTGSVQTSPIHYSVVLLAEDDPVLRQTLSDFLADEGFLVREASDVATVRRCLADDTPSAIVLDLNLTDGDVAGVLRELAERQERPNVVLISAASRAEKVARENRAQFIAKPLDLERLVQALLLPVEEPRA